MMMTYDEYIFPRFDGSCCLGSTCGGGFDGVMFRKLSFLSSTCFCLQQLFTFRRTFFVFKTVVSNWWFLSAEMEPGQEPF
jgi:hypothetical protein